MYEDAHLEMEYEDRNGGVTEWDTRDFDDYEEDSNECLDWCPSWDGGECEC